MTISFKKVLLGMVALLLLVVQTTMEADIHEEFKTDGDSPEVLLRKATGAFDLQKNTVSNIEFYTTNYGIFGYNVANRTGGSHWPRNSLNQYIFAGGVWLGAKVEKVDYATGEKIIDPETGRPELKKLCELTYNPRDGSSWMVPGRIKDETGFPTPMVDNDASAVAKYRTYFATDFLGNGEPIDEADGPSWPIWDASSDELDTLKTKRYFGYYIEDIDRRTDAFYAKGPAFISGEDIFATYKDTDLRYYEGGYSQAQQKGYPFEIQYEQMIYSWGFGDYKDFIFIKYDLISFNDDTLRDCWLAPVMDVDIAREPNTSAGAVNDRVRYYNEDSTLNMAVQWSQADRGEGGRGFGYLGYDFLESPAVQGDTLADGSPNPLQGFLRTDKRKYSNAEQLGLQTFNNWNIADDLTEDQERYDFLSTLARDGDEGSGDKRFMMATGPFNMKPYDTARVVVGIIIAESVKDLAAPDGTTEDMAALVTKDKFAQTVYDNNFKAPMPPRRARLSAEGVNNGVVLSWDDYSELSEDNEENGLDFMGYKLYRARRNDIAAYTNHQTDTSGPLGWRQIAEWSIPTAFEKSVHKAGDPEDEHIMPYIDSLLIIGPVVDELYSKVDPQDEFSIRVMRVCRGCIMERPDFFNLSTTNADTTQIIKFDTLNIPMIVDIDTSEAVNGPWGKYFYSVANKSRLGVNLNQYRFEAAYPGNSIAKINENRAKYLDNGYRYDPKKKDFLLDSILVGTVELKSALLDYNPLFYVRETSEISLAQYQKFQNYVNYPSQFADYDTLRWSFTSTTDSNGKEVQVKEKVQEIYFFSTAIKQRRAGRDIYVIEHAPLTDDVQMIMSNAQHLQYVNDMLYTYIKNGKANVKFPMFEELTTYQAVKLDSLGNPYTELDTIIDLVDFPQTKRIREGLIPEYMAKITDNRTYIDLGDNGDGKFYYNEDPAETEQMINNVDYFYKIISYDEGDYQQPTEIKPNDASLALPNALTVRPKAAAITEDVNFNIEIVTPERIGGLYDFKFTALDQQRVSQFFAGHVLELEFKPYWTLGSVTFTGESTPTYFGKYGRFMTLTDTTNGQLLYEGLTEFENDPGIFTYTEAFTENGLSYVYADSVISDPISGADINFAEHDSREVRERFGVWTTGEMEEALYPPYVGTSMYTFGEQGAYVQARGFQKPAYGALAFKFNYHIKQYGGDFRMDTVLVRNSNGDEKAVDLIIPRYTDYGRQTLNIESNDKLVETFAKEDANTVTTQMIGMDYQQKAAQKAIYGIPGSAYMNATMVNDYGNPIVASYNNGPGTYEVEFTGKEKRTINVWFIDKTSKDTIDVKFDVDVLTVNVKNTTKFERIDNNGGTALVSYEADMQHMTIDPAPYDNDGYSHYGRKSSVGNSPAWVPVYEGQNLYTKAYPYPVNTMAKGIHPDELYNTYNMFAAGWINCREESKEMSVRISGYRFARQLLENGKRLNEDGYEILYTGLQGAYALPATSADGQYTIDFVNVIYISGVPFFFDGANAGSNIPDRTWDQVDQENFKYGGANFEVGDKLILSTTGGALGLPAPGAKVRIEVGGSPIDADKLSDDDLEAIKVVPNPYFISHQGQQSPYGAELYFTRLPEECTIDIYTVTGELVKRIEHNELNSADPDKVSVDIWNLLSDNNQRVASQALVAVITTPSGATTVKNFSVIVGSYRIITD